MFNYRISKSSFPKDAPIALYYVALFAFTVSLLANQSSYIKSGLHEVMILDGLSLIFIYGTLFLFLLKKISFRLSSAVFIYTSILNLSISIWYYYYHDYTFSNSLLLNTFIFSIYLVVAGFCNGRRHIFYVAGVYLASHIPLIYISHDPFLVANAFPLIFLIIVYSLALRAVLYMLQEANNKEKELSKAILEKDNAALMLQTEFLNFQLETTQRELTSKTMMLLQHSESLAALIQKISTLKEKILPENKSRLETIIQQHQLNHLQNYWREFEISFLKTSPDFYKKLQALSPVITTSERKLAALIHLDLSSKQIGIICSISPESVDVARSRLRRRLNVEPGTNLNHFLNNL